MEVRKKRDTKLGEKTISQLKRYNSCHSFSIEPECIDYAIDCTNKIQIANNSQCRELTLERALELAIQWADEMDCELLSSEEWKEYESEIEDMGYCEAIKYIILKLADKELCDE